MASTGMVNENPLASSLHATGYPVAGSARTQTTVTAVTLTTITVVIRSTAGYEGKLQDAMIEVKRGHVVTTNPVDITFNNGSLRADRMEIFDNGARAVFEGGITMFMKLPPAKDEAQE